MNETIANYEVGGNNIYIHQDIGDNQKKISDNNNSGMLGKILELIGSVGKPTKKKRFSTWFPGGLN